MSDMDDIRDLASQLAPPPRNGWASRRGTIVTVHTGPPVTADLTIAGVTIPGVPVYVGLTVTAGDNVEVGFDGPAPRIVGKTS